MLTCTSFHPDGHLLAAGTSTGEIHLFDIKSGALAASFSSQPNSPITSLVFSENGTWLASVCSGSTEITVWDLRKASGVANIKALELGFEALSLFWDYTGQFLLAGGVGGISVQQYSKASKEWSEPLRLAVPATAVTWTKAAKGMLALSAEGALTLIRPST